MLEEIYEKARLEAEEERERDFQYTSERLYDLITEAVRRDHNSIRFKNNPVGHPESDIWLEGNWSQSMTWEALGEAAHELEEFDSRFKYHETKIVLLGITWWRSATLKWSLKHG